MEIRDGTFYIDNNDKRTQKRLLMAINDNVHKNIDGFSMQLFDESLRYKKEAFTPEEKELICDRVIESSDRKKQKELLFDSTDRILYAHRNLKMLLLMTSGPFFAVMFVVKYSIKFSVLYFLYKKKTEAEARLKLESLAGTADMKPLSTNQ